MSSEVATIWKLRRLPWSVLSNAANQIFLQLTLVGSVFVLFLSELGLSKSQTGLVLSLLPFTGVLALAAAPYVARIGYKRSYLTFFGLRAGSTALLLLTPWIVGRYGMGAALLFVIAMVAVYGVLRTLGMTAWFPWTKEFVPDSVRGKYTAINGAVMAASGFIAILAARFILERMSGLSGYMLLIAIGIVLGLAAVATATRIPGGSAEEPAAQNRERRLKEALADGNFRRYLAGIGIYVGMIMPIYAFLPLFMQEQVGLSAGNIVLLQAGTLVGGALTGYLWGWAADRFGSKPVMLSGLALTALLPIAWILMPRQHALSLVIALAIAFVQGIAQLSYQSGSSRLLYVNLMPATALRKDYTAIFFAWMGLVGGMGKLISGWLLDATASLQGQWSIIPLDPYLPLFVLGAIMPLVAVVLVRAVQTDDSVSPREFLQFFVKGNAFQAVEGMVGYHLAKEEKTAVDMTERLGQAKSPLATGELLAALHDPRFWVRIEALIAIAHMPPQRSLQKALVEILHGRDQVLSVLAAWAMGRMGDPAAVGPLREGLDAESDVLQEYSARALGFLHDEEMIPHLLKRFRETDDEEVRIACASALGHMGVEEALPDLLALLRETQDPTARSEIGLALARIIGEEKGYLHLAQQRDGDEATALAQAVLGLKKRIILPADQSDALFATVETCADALGRGCISDGMQMIRTLIDDVPHDYLRPSCSVLLCELSPSLTGEGAVQPEFLLLALHTLSVGWKPQKQIAL